MKNKPTFCTRFMQPSAAEFSARAEGEELYIEGYFAVFGAKYRLWEEAYETVDRGAFTDQTKEDVRALCNHDTTLVLGRVPAGTLTLREDEIGLWGSIRINRADQDAMNLYERVKRKDVNQCSFGFDILEQEIEHTEGQPSVFRIKRVRLYEVSVVTFPAYEDTSVEARKAELATVVKRRVEEKRRLALERLKGVNYGN